MTENKKTKIAICYDFDGTLSPDYMQNVTFLPKLGFKDPNVFWDEVKENAKKQNMDEILSYLNLMIDKAKEKEVPLTPRFLMECGQDITLFEGVKTWFDRINEYALLHNIDVEHYIITSGNVEIVKGTSISKKFKYIFGCRFAYIGTYINMIAEKPAAAVNYTNKTQFLFRINKGVFNYYENDIINRYMAQEDKYIDFSNMIYIGDGETDVPCFKMVSYQGGKSIAVFNPEIKAKKEIKDINDVIIQAKKKSAEELAKDLLSHKRVDFIAPTDYAKDSKLDKIVKNIIEEISLRNN